ncbi:hypothetical protein CIPAW_14G079500 [Carya illinoinensis]|uniref:Uncharacterized protein n=1 Tax=Carya illinoinensis TaxID=32201 RepID=A0A8T1NKP4_CARIL|nr:hypothetical protein CIPAW_14G079500 [Carya illinoinensis]
MKMQRESCHRLPTFSTDENVNHPNESIYQKLKARKNPQLAASRFGTSKGLDENSQKPELLYRFGLPVVRSFKTQELPCSLSSKNRASPRCPIFCFPSPFRIAPSPFCLPAPLLFSFFGFSSQCTLHFLSFRKPSLFFLT